MNCIVTLDFYKVFQTSKPTKQPTNHTCSLKEWGYFNFSACQDNLVFYWPGNGKLAQWHYRLIKILWSDKGIERLSVKYKSHLSFFLFFQLLQSSFVVTRDHLSPTNKHNMITEKQQHRSYIVVLFAHKSKTGYHCYSSSVLIYRVHTYKGFI